MKTIKLKSFSNAEVNYCLLIGQNNPSNTYQFYLGTSILAVCGLYFHKNYVSR
ncbi:hypothetical protein [Flavobacterium sp. IB48]|uniref:hypothetical protein n=1 Tax=Flavobacterium sp. IB48 TaxID=2779375 RepID=UPI0018E8A850|nr:hypothetical protein [Flavobacterium sp. IB48]MBJ2127004.1 hypothetical protein [Flavobacterium sp. IB48]